MYRQGVSDMGDHEYFAEELEAAGWNVTPPVWVHLQRLSKEQAERNYHSIY